MQVRKENNGDVVVRHAIYEVHDGRKADEPRSWMEMRVTREGVLVPNQPLHVKGYTPELEAVGTKPPSAHQSRRTANRRHA
jgi:hypothetical protein